jgi:hypothetical protein
MGTAHKSKSTRVSRGRSVRSSPRPHTKPTSRRATARPHRRARPKPAGLRRAADVLRIVAGGSGTKLRISSALAVTLREIHERLEAALSATCLCAIALKAQAADHDVDIALCLECCVEQVISNEMEHIDNVLRGGAS